MKKREFLAAGGAVPLMLAGCGGDKGGSANVRLINASVGYAKLGFMVGTTQATSTDVAYGDKSPFENVDSGSVTTTLTVETSAGTNTSLLATTRSFSKGTRYTIVAYGYSGNLKSVLITETQNSPDSGYAYLNVLNTSTDIGAVDVYVTTDGNIASSTATPLVSNLSFGQSRFLEIAKGPYVVTVTGYNAKTDLRLTIPSITLVDQQVATLILSPGLSGVLANGILMTQGSDGAVVSYPNTKARIRAVAATDPSTPVTVGSILTNAVSPKQTTSYTLVDTSSLPTVTVGGASIGIVPTGTLTTNALQPGCDYTILVYGPTGSVVAQLLLDDNTLPTTSGYIKVGLLNAAMSTGTGGLPLTLFFNSKAVASDIPEDAVSTYTQVQVSSTSSSSNASATLSSDGFTTLLTVPVDNVTAGNTYLATVAGVYNEASPSSSTLKANFFSAR